MPQGEHERVLCGGVLSMTSRATIRAEVNYWLDRAGSDPHRALVMACQHMNVLGHAISAGYARVNPYVVPATPHEAPPSIEDISADDPHAANPNS